MFVSQTLFLALQHTHTSGNGRAHPSRGVVTAKLWADLGSPNAIPGDAEATWGTRRAPLESGPSKLWADAGSPHGIPGYAKLHNYRTWATGHARPSRGVLTLQIMCRCWVPD